MASPSHFHHYSLDVPIALLAALLRRSSASAAAALAKVRQLHALVATTTVPSTSSPFLSNNILSIYTKCGSLADARKVFDRMPTRTIVSYNAMISAYARAPRHALCAFRLFLDLPRISLSPNASTLASLVRASASLDDPWAGAAVHSVVLSHGFSNNVCIQTALIGMYSEFGYIESAHYVFDEMAERDAVAWNSIIFSNVRLGNTEKGLRMFRSMVRGGSKPNLSTFSIALSACGRAGDWDRGRAVHAKIVQSELPPDVPLQNALLGMYSSCGDLAAAIAVFDGIEVPDLVSWNSLLAGYADSGEGDKAMDVFVRLRAGSPFGGPNPDEYTFAAVVSATANWPSMFYGKALHAQINKTGFEPSIYVGNTLINMYFVNDEPDSARKLFSCIPGKDAVIWTEMIIGHSTSGEAELSIKYFCDMLEEGHKADNFSLSSALNSSAELAALKQGEMLHSFVLKSGYGENMCVGGSLVDMYAKGGNLEGARSVFYSITNSDMKCWNSLIGAYGNHGDAERAFKIFSEMVGRGLQPDHVTYVSLLSACSHSGLVERGRFYWFCMTSDGMKPGLKHYTCMASLLGRAGHLQEAGDLIVRSPFANGSPELWRILLSWCVHFKNLPIGIYAAEQVFSMEPADGGTHVLLSNLYASTGQWDNVAEMRKRIRELNLEKDPGLSWIEMKSLVHVFSSDDDSHMQVDNCRDELLRLQGNLNEREVNEVPVSL